MKILICNDDGIGSDGIFQLTRALSKNNEVLVVAPDGNRSASGHSITIGKRLYLKEVNLLEGVKAYSLSGTPADCVKFAVNSLDFKPDAVVSGINFGPNLGTDILYSGTVSAALEAVSFDLPSVAVSLSGFTTSDYSYSAEFIAKNIDDLIKSNDGSFVWNVNVPELKKEDIKGVKFTKMGFQVYSDAYNMTDDGGYILTGVPIAHDRNEEDCDVEWNLKGYITITPIIFNKTDFKILKKTGITCRM